MFCAINTPTSKRQWVINMETADKNRKKRKSSDVDEWLYDFAIKPSRIFLMLQMKYYFTHHLVMVKRVDVLKGCTGQFRRKAALQSDWYGQSLLQSGIRLGAFILVLVLIPNLWNVKKHVNTCRYYRWNWVCRWTKFFNDSEIVYTPSGLEYGYFSKLLSAKLFQLVICLAVILVMVCCVC